MSEIFLERTFSPSIGQGDVLTMAHDAAGCMVRHRVDWECSMLSQDGKKMICWFRARDAESARIALRESGADTVRLWPGTVHDAPDPVPDPANVIVERSFDEPVMLDEIQAIEDAGASCLETHNVRFVRTFFATTRRRMICLYLAPDAESVRVAQRQANMPFSAVWSFRTIRLDR